MLRIARWSLVTALLCCVVAHAASHALPPLAKRPLPKGPTHFVDAAKGDDAAAGTEEAPWRTIAHALAQLDAGDTLCLRGGVYYEQVSCSLVGTKDKPITIRSYPGERVILDGGYREFAENPAAAWVPVADGGEGEFRSARRYRNLTGVAGSFGDSNQAVLSYYLLSDLRTKNERRKLDPDSKIMTASVYVGPGLWYDRTTGYIHCRLAHTHNENPLVENYRGETDPRKLPLVIAPIRSVPLTLDRAMHVRLQDIAIRGAGRVSLAIDYCTGIDIDGVVIVCSGIDGKYSGPVRITNSTVLGAIPPWLWRIDCSKGCASGRTRDIVYLLTDTQLATCHQMGGHTAPRLIANDRIRGQAEGFRAVKPDTPDALSPQMVFPERNHDWEVANCEFVDGHDGIFLVGRNMRFHHNLVDNMQDDAIDISCALPKPDDTMYIHHNVVRRCVSGISTHNFGMGGPRGAAFIYRNIIDMSLGIQWMRGTDDEPEGKLYAGFIYNVHGSKWIEHFESVYFYQNTCLDTTRGLYAFAHHLMGGKEGAIKRVFNNIFVYINDDGRYPPPLYGCNPSRFDLQLDGNLHWNPHPDAVVPPKYFDKLRAFPIDKEKLAEYPSGYATNDVAGDPKFVDYVRGRQFGNDWRLQKDSPALGKGVVLPAEWPDTDRPVDGARPDIGAMQAGAEPLRIGIGGRIVIETP